MGRSQVLYHLTKGRYRHRHSTHPSNSTKTTGDKSEENGEKLEEGGGGVVPVHVQEAPVTVATTATTTTKKKKKKSSRTSAKMEKSLVLFDDHPAPTILYADAAAAAATRGEKPQPRLPLTDDDCLFVTHDETGTTIDIANMAATLTSAMSVAQRLRIPSHVAQSLLLVSHSHAMGMPATAAPITAADADGSDDASFSVAHTRIRVGPDGQVEARPKPGHYENPLAAADSSDHDDNQQQQEEEKENQPATETADLTIGKPADLATGNYHPQTSRTTTRSTQRTASPVSLEEQSVDESYSIRNLQPASEVQSSEDEAAEEEESFTTDNGEYDHASAEPEDLALRDVNFGYNDDDDDDDDDDEEEDDDDGRDRYLVMIESKEEEEDDDEEEEEDPYTARDENQAVEQQEEPSTTGGNRNKYLYDNDTVTSVSLPPQPLTSGMSSVNLLNPLSPPLPPPASTQPPTLRPRLPLQIDTLVQNQHCTGSWNRNSAAAAATATATATTINTAATLTGPTPKHANSRQLAMAPSLSSEEDNDDGQDDAAGGGGEEEDAYLEDWLDQAMESKSADAQHHTSALVYHVPVEPIHDDGAGGHDLYQPHPSITSQEEEEENEDAMSYTNRGVIALLPAQDSSGDSTVSSLTAPKMAGKRTTPNRMVGTPSAQQQQQQQQQQWDKLGNDHSQSPSNNYSKKSTKKGVNQSVPPSGPRAMDEVRLFSVLGGISTSGSSTGGTSTTMDSRGQMLDDDGSIQPQQLRPYHHHHSSPPPYHGVGSKKKKKMAASLPNQKSHNRNERGSRVRDDRGAEDLDAWLDRVIS